jgi:ParB-like nuclease domain
MLMTGSPQMDAERAFTRTIRDRRRAALKRRLRGEAAERGRLAVYEQPRRRRAAADGVLGLREIPVEQIRGTLEPSRASLFDDAFRPSRAARERWQRVWLAEHRGVVLPPISVVRVGDTYAVRDGHHRLSVAKARGAATIDATIDDAIAAT